MPDREVKPDVEEAIATAKRPFKDRKDILGTQRMVDREYLKDGDVTVNVFPTMPSVQNARTPKPWKPHG